MASIRSLVLALALPASLVACGGGDDGQQPPSGMHYTYVVNKVNVPMNNSQAAAFGLDLDGDGDEDNQLGMVLGTLAGQGFKVQDTLDTAVNQGSIIILADFQTPSFSSTNGAGLSVKLGKDPMPAACNGSADTTCGHHFTGTASFAISTDPMATLEGKVKSGTFTGGPGTVSLQIALGGTTPIPLTLIGARAKGTGLSETALGEVIVAGAVTKEDIDTKVIPAVHEQLGPLIARDCTMLDNPPGCGCPSGSTGATVISLFDIAEPKDCAVTVEEIRMSSLAQTLLAPDVVIDGKDALSLGIKVTTVGAVLR